jgi:hypothetical protein
MPKDNRKILSGVRVSGKGVFAEGQEDELAAAVSQDQLDRLTEKRAIAGDWKIAKAKGKSNETKEETKTETKEEKVEK